MTNVRIFQTQTFLQSIKKIALRYVTAEHEGKMTDAEYEAYFEQKQQALNLHYGELFAGRF